MDQSGDVKRDVVERALALGYSAEQMVEMIEVLLSDWGAVGFQVSERGYIRRVFDFRFKADLLCLFGVVDAVFGLCYVSRFLDEMRSLSSEFEHGKCAVGMELHICVTGELKALLKTDLSGWDKCATALVSRPAQAWHVVLMHDKDLAAFDSGFCYLRIMKFAKHKLAKVALGLWPSFCDLLQAPSEWFPNVRALKNYTVYTDDMDLPPPALRAVTAFDALLGCALSSGRVYNEGTLGLRLLGYADSVPFVVTPVATDVLGGVGDVEVAQRYSVYVRGPTRKYVKYLPPLSVRACESVFSKVMSEWGLTGADEDTVLSSIAECCLPTTSAKRPLTDVGFLIGDQWYYCTPFISALKLASRANNAFRLWVRSFRYGELCFRMQSILQAKENDEQISAASYRFSVDKPYAYLGFDCVREISKYTGAGVLDRMLIRMSRAKKFKVGEVRGYNDLVRHMPLLNPIYLSAE